jgi:hypothetical protein
MLFNLAAAQMISRVVNGQVLLVNGLLCVTQLGKTTFEQKSQAGRNPGVNRTPSCNSPPPTPRFKTKKLHLSIPVKKIKVFISEVQQLSLRL